MVVTASRSEHWRERSRQKRLNQQINLVRRGGNDSDGSPGLDQSDGGEHYGGSGASK